MSTETLKASETEPQILPDGSIYAVWCGDGWFSSFDEDGYVFLSKIKHCVTKEEAEETARQICDKTGEKVGDRVTVVPISAGELGFWVKHSSCGGYTDLTVKCAPAKRSVYENVPDWFKAALMAHATNDLGWDDNDIDDGTNAVDLFHQIAGRWQDHTGWSGEGEDSKFVSEPYHLEAQDIENLVETCRVFNFNYQISGHSSHYPSATMRILISPKERLPYQPRIRVISPEQARWEADRDRALHSLVRTLACDYIEHVAGLVENSDDEDYGMFVDTSLSVVRRYATGEERDQDILRSYHELAGRKYRELRRQGRNIPTQRILFALDRATAQDKEVDEYLHISVGILCRDAVEDRFLDEHVFQKEMAWQAEHARPFENDYAKKWGGSFEDHKEGMC